MRSLEFAVRGGEVVDGFPLWSQTALTYLRFGSTSSMTKDQTLNALGDPIGSDRIMPMHR